jgi:hypothetical protein
VDKTAALETEFGASSISLRFRRTTPDSSRRIEAFAIYRTGASGLPTKLQPSLYHCLVATGGCPRSDGANRSGKAHRGTPTLGPEAHRKSGEAVSAPIARTIALAPLRLADPRRLSRNTPTCQAPREAPEIGNALRCATSEIAQEPHIMLTMLRSMPRLMMTSPIARPITPRVEILRTRLSRFATVRILAGRD